MASVVLLRLLEYRGLWFCVMVISDESLCALARRDEWDLYCDEGVFCVTCCLRCIYLLAIGDIWWDAAWRLILELDRDLFYGLLIGAASSELS